LAEGAARAAGVDVEDGRHGSGEKSARFEGFDEARA
jgi:hypothetical protein